MLKKGWWGWWCDMIIKDSSRTVRGQMLVYSVPEAKCICPNICILLKNHFNETYHLCYIRSFATVAMSFISWASLYLCLELIGNCYWCRRNFLFLCLQVTSYFHQIVDKMRLTFTDLEQAKTGGVAGKTLWLLVDNELRRRKDAAAQAKGFIDQCYRSYLNKIPIATPFNVRGNFL